MRRLMTTLVAAALVVGVLAPSVGAVGYPWHRPMTVDSIEFIGEVNFDTGFEYRGVEVGGLSAITYDANADIYYSLSDDRSQFAPSRFYTLTIDVGDGSLDPGDVTFIGETTLLGNDGRPYAEFATDPEGMVLNPRDYTLYLASEGDAVALVDPFVNQYTLGGTLIDELRIRNKYLPVADGTFGIRQNLAFESLAITPNGRKLITATEGALAQDGPAASLTEGSYVRVMVFKLPSERPAGEWVYPVDPVVDEPIPEGSFIVNGLVELLPIDNRGTMLALERSFSVGVPGNDIRLYETSIRGVKDVTALQALDGATFDVMKKELVLDLDDLGLLLDNVEGMVFGPMLPDGRQSLIMVSDNNFNPNGQFTQFLAFAVELAKTK